MCICGSLSEGVILNCTVLYIISCTGWCLGEPGRSTCAVCRKLYSTVCHTGCREWSMFSWSSSLILRSEIRFPFFMVGWIEEIFVVCE